MHRGARSCPCGARRTGPGTAPSCRGGDNGHRRRRGERCDVDTVGICTASEPSAPSASGGPGRTPRCGRRSSRSRPQNALKDAQRQRLRGGRVECGDDRALSHHECQHREAGRVGLVQMQHVEIAGRDPPLDQPVSGRAEAQPGHRTVVRNRHRFAAGDHVVGQCDMRRGRRQDADDVPTRSRITWASCNT